MPSDRKAKRDSLFLLTSVSSPDGHARGKVRVRNLSAKGLMADCPFPIIEGEAVILNVRGVGPVSGAVVWINGDKIGVAFDNPIDPARARMPVSSSATAMPDFRSEEHTSELQSLMRISYAVFCLKKTKINIQVLHIHLISFRT